MSINSEKDELIVLEYDSFDRTSLAFTKVKLLDIQIKKLSNISVLSRITPLYANNIRLLLIGEDGTSMTLHLTPKTYRAKLPTKQTNTTTGEYPNSDVLNIESFYVVLVKNQTHSLVSLINKEVFLPYYFKYFEGDIQSIAAYSYTENYTLVLISYTDNDQNKSEVQAVHYAQPKNGVHIFKEDKNFVAPDVQNAEFVIEPNSGHILMFKGDEISSFDFLKTSCSIDFMDSSKERTNAKLVEKNCIKRVETIIDIENADKDVEDQSNVVQIAFYSILVLCIIASIFILWIAKSCSKYNTLIESNDLGLDDNQPSQKCVNVFILKAEDMENKYDICSICMLPYCSDQNASFDIDFIEKSLKSQREAPISERRKSSIALVQIAQTSNRVSN